jgi:hypothetical protein
MNSTNLNIFSYENECVLAPIKVEILFIFPLKIKRLQRKAGLAPKKKTAIVSDSCNLKIKLF